MSLTFAHPPTGRMLFGICFSQSSTVLSRVVLIAVTCVIWFPGVEELRDIAIMLRSEEVLSFPLQCFGFAVDPDCRPRGFFADRSGNVGDVILREEVMVVVAVVAAAIVAKRLSSPSSTSYILDIRAPSRGARSFGTLQMNDKMHTVPMLIHPKNGYD